MSRLPPRPAATLASWSKFCWAASMSFRAFAAAPLSAFIRSILAATAICTWPACWAMKAAAIEATSIRDTHDLRTGETDSGDDQVGDGVDLGAVGEMQDVVLGIHVSAVGHADQKCLVDVFLAGLDID